MNIIHIFPRKFKTNTIRLQENITTLLNNNPCLTMAPGKGRNPGLENPGSQEPQIKEKENE